MPSGMSGGGTVALVVGCLIVVVAGGVVGADAVVAQEKLNVGVDAPREATVGESVNLSATVSIPDLARDVEKELTVTFYSNGQQIGSDTVTVVDGETTQAEITYTFETEGNKEIEAEATVTLGGQEYAGSGTATISVVEAQEQISLARNLSLSVNTPDSPQVSEETTTTVESDIPSVTGIQEGELALRLLVDGEEAASKSTTVSNGETTEADFTVVFDSSGQTAVTVEATLTVGEQTLTKNITRTISVSEAPSGTTIKGGAFSVPESLTDEVESYRDDVSQDLQAQTFVLATQDQLYVVFTDQEPAKGVASVEGAVLERELSTENLTYGVIAATSASFNTTGTEVSVREVSENAEQYQLELVRINAHYRRVSTLSDPDGGDNFTASTTSGILVEKPQSPVSLFQNVGSDVRALSRNTSPDQIDTILNDPQVPHLHTVSFETKFWTDADATVDAIVLDPQSAAQQFIEEYDQAGIAHAEDGEPILYVVEEDFQPQQFENIADIKSQSVSLDGEVVEITANLYQEKISVQETLENNTSCDADLLEIQTPQGPACVNVVQDNLLHGGVAWDSLPQSRTDALLVMGVSSRHQDSSGEFEAGKYRIEGEVVSTSRVNESLPEGSVLVMHDLERLGEINYGERTQNARSVIETRTAELSAQLRQQVGEGEIEIVTRRTTEMLQSISPSEPATVSFSQSSSQIVSAQQARITVSRPVTNARVDVAKVASLPSEVSQPAGQSIRILNISSTIADANIENASVQLRISRAAIPSGEEVAVARYHDGAWNTLNTTIVEESEINLAVNVKTPGFSYFAVTTQAAGSGLSEGGEDDTSASDGQQTDGVTQTANTGEIEGTQSGDEAETSGTSVPGFTILSSVMAVLLFVGLRLRKLR